MTLNQVTLLLYKMVMKDEVEENQFNVSMDVEQEQTMLKNYHNFIKFSSYDELPSLKYEHQHKTFNLKTLHGAYHKNVINPLANRP